MEAPRRFFGTNRHAEALNALLQATTSRRASLGPVTPRFWHHGDGGEEEALRPRRRGLFASRADPQPVARKSGGLGTLLLMGGVMALGIAASTLLFRTKQSSGDATRTEAAVDAAAAQQAAPPGPPSRTTSPAPTRPPPRPSSESSRGPSPARERMAASAAASGAPGRTRPPTPPAPPARKEHAFTAKVRPSAGCARFCPR